MSEFATDLAAEKVPSLRTPQLLQAIDFWQYVMGFELKHHIPGVLAILVKSATQLQVGQVARDGVFKAGSHRVAVQDVFAMHRAMARFGRGSLSGEPQLQCWGAWEFSVTDVDGNRLRLAQWAANSVFNQNLTAAEPCITAIRPGRVQTKPPARLQLKPKRQI